MIPESIPRGGTANLATGPGVIGSSSRLDAEGGPSFAVPCLVSQVWSRLFGPAAPGSGPGYS